MAPCLLCNDQKKRHDADARLAFEFTAGQISDSAYERGCESCLVILEGIRQSETIDWSLQKDVRRVYVRCCERVNGKEDTLSLEIYFVDDRPKLEIEFYSLQPHSWYSIRPRPSVSRHPLSSEALQWVGSLLDSCTRTHTSCASSERFLLPKRVLFVQDLSTATCRVRLVEHQEDCSSYVALSHCWGGKQTCITTTETLEERKADIPWSIIPQTFQDAILFALRLGIHYIWIDSLCILQNDSTDWEIESSKMADIYQHAFITLAATASTGDSQGCFQPMSRAEEELELTLPADVGSCRIAVRRPLKHWDTTIATHQAAYFPLLSRGWAFQERLLSPRVLHFCRSELVWECRERSVCECGGLSDEPGPSAKFHRFVESKEEPSTQATSSERNTDDLDPDLLLALQIQQEEDDWELAMMMQDEELDSESVAIAQDGTVQPGESSSPNRSPSALAGSGPLRTDSIPTSISTFTLSRPPTYAEPTSDRSLHFKCSKVAQNFQRFIEQYSALSITEATDRLPALSGMCKRMAHLRGDYLAGLWSDSLCFDLMWRVNTLTLDVEEDGKPLEYRGPTWSWVSNRNPVSYWLDIIDFTDKKQPSFHDTGFDGIIIVDPEDRRTETEKSISALPLGQNPDGVVVEVQRRGQNFFGEVSSATLTATASCVKATLLYTYASYWHGRTNELDPVRYNLEIKRSPLSESKVEVPFFADYALGVEGPRQIAEGTRLTLLLIHPKVSLVLKPRRSDPNKADARGSGEVLWERVGIARIPDALLRFYRVDWMKDSKAKQFRIV